MWDRNKKRGTNGVPETGILARAEAAVQGILQILDSACQAKTVSEAGVSMVGKTHRFQPAVVMGWPWMTHMP